VIITQCLHVESPLPQKSTYQVHFRKRYIESIHIAGAIPFNIHTPLCTRSIKFEPLRKKDQSADTNTPPEIKKFLPYPSEKAQRSKDADAHNPSETAFSNPLRNYRP
jgi:hypothetical protein